MDSEEETLYDDVDSGNESSGDDVDFAMEIESANPRERPTDTDDYPFEVLSTEEIVQHMVDCIKEVNTVVEVSVSTDEHSSNRETLFFFFNCSSPLFRYINSTEEKRKICRSDSFAMIKAMIKTDTKDRWIFVYKSRSGWVEQIFTL